MKHKQHPFPLFTFGTFESTLQGVIEGLYKNNYA